MERKDDFQLVTVFVIIGGGTMFFEDHYGNMWKWNWKTLTFQAWTGESFHITDLECPAYVRKHLLGKA